MDGAGQTRVKRPDDAYDLEGICFILAGAPFDCLLKRAGQAVIVSGGGILRGRNDTLIVCNLLSLDSKLV